jgi:hypothetical protein
MTKRPDAPHDIPTEEIARADVTAEQIAAHAYERFLRRGGSDGYDIDDWLAAEQELRGAVGISNRPVEEEERDQGELPKRGTRREHSP